jgi:hypothetical protein
MLALYKGSITGSASAAATAAVAKPFPDCRGGEAAAPAHANAAVVESTALVPFTTELM